MRFPDYVEEILRCLTDAGFEAFVVGGSLRDMLLGREAHDFDVATSARPEEMMDVFSSLRVIPTGISHGTLTVLSDGHAVEVTTYRIDGDYTDSRHPDSVSFTKNLEEDLARRDFTVNAMAAHPERGLYDPFGGQEDLKKRILCAVGDPRVRFREDALRILRAYRFAAQLDFSLEEATERAIVEMREGLFRIARERIGNEFTRLLTSAAPARALLAMKRDGVLPMVLGLAVSEERLAEVDLLSPVLSLRLGVLLRGRKEEEKRSALRGLRLSSAQTDAALRAAEAFSAPFLRGEAEARRFLYRYGEAGEELALAGMALGLADEAFVSSVKKAKADGVCLSKQELAVGGEELISLGLCGKEVGLMLDTFMEAVLVDPTLNTKDALFALAQRKEKKNKRADCLCLWKRGTMDRIKATKGKLLGVDFGDTRTGIALCDPSRLLASGQGMISPGGIEKTADAIAEIAKKEGVVGIVVGLPVNMDGSEGGRAQRCRKLCRLIEERTGLPCAAFDERMTTMTAARYLDATGTRGKKRKGVIDTLSAQIILQNCLDRLKAMPKGEK